MIKKHRLTPVAVMLVEVILLIFGLISLAKEKYPAGDINNDGITDISDYTLLRLDMVGAQRLSIRDLKRADINNDGFADQADLDLIRNIILEQEP